MIFDEVNHYHEKVNKIERKRTLTVISIFPDVVFSVFLAARVILNSLFGPSNTVSSSSNVQSEMMLEKPKSSTSVK